MVKQHIINTKDKELRIKRGLLLYGIPEFFERCFVRLYFIIDVGQCVRKALFPYI